MEREKDEVLVPSNQAGIEKVLQDQGSYAFFMESTTIEYQTERDCRLQQIGGKLDSKSYGVALPQGNVQKINLFLSLIALFILICIKTINRRIMAISEFN